MISLKILSLFGMIFCHIFDDYYLQGILASMKQQSWWKEKAPDTMYRNDYKMALFCHSFSWAFSIMVIPFAWEIFNPTENSIARLCVLCGFFMANLALHMLIDNEKANKHTISLVQDQTFHIFQIVFTWIITVFGRV